MYNLMVFSILTESYNHHQNLILEHFIIPELNLVPISSPFSIPFT